MGFPRIVLHRKCCRELEVRDAWKWSYSECLRALCWRYGKASQDRACRLHRREKQGCLKGAATSHSTYLHLNACQSNDCNSWVPTVSSRVTVGRPGVAWGSFTSEHSHTAALAFLTWLFHNQGLSWLAFLTCWLCPELLTQLEVSRWGPGVGRFRGDWPGMAALCDEFLGFQPPWFSHLGTAKKIKVVTHSLFI